MSSVFTAGLCMVWQRVCCKRQDRLCICQACWHLGEDALNSYQIKVIQEHIQFIWYSNSCCNMIVIYDICILYSVFWKQRCSSCAHQHRIVEWDGTHLQDINFMATFPTNWFRSEPIKALLAEASMFWIHQVSNFEQLYPLAHFLLLSSMVCAAKPSVHECGRASQRKAEGKRWGSSLHTRTAPHLFRSTPETTPKDGSGITQKCFHNFSFKRLVPLFACAELSWHLRSLNARYFWVSFWCTTFLQCLQGHSDFVVLQTALMWRCCWIGCKVGFRFILSWSWKHLKYPCIQKFKKWGSRCRFRF